MRQIEQKVLDLYSGVSPSFTPADNPEDFAALKKRRENVLRNLNLLPPIFENRTLIDLGSGTGEHTLMYALWGAMVTGVEFNPKSIERMRALFAAHGVSDKLAGIHFTPVSEWKPDRTFDIGVSDGVLHHLSDPHEGFVKLARSVKPGGLCFISTGGHPGYEQREIIRDIVRAHSTNLADAVALSHRLFPVYMERAVRLARRTDEQIVNDNFLVDQNEPLDLETAVQWFHEEGFTSYRVFPNIEPLTAMAPAHDPIDWFEPGNRGLLIQNAKDWAICRDGGVMDARMNSEERKRGHEEIDTMRRFSTTEGVDKIADYLSQCRYFGHGFCGVGAYFVAGIKRAA